MCVFGGAPESNVQVIAEPGRYFAETAATLLTPIYGIRGHFEALSKGCCSPAICKGPLTPGSPARAPEDPS